MVVDNKYLSSKLVSKEEASMANASCRVYYGEAAGAIPFMWESQPGTPKHPSSQSSLPPLTPPPSYSATPRNSKRTLKMTSKSKFLDTIFPRLGSLGKMLKPPNSMSPPSLSSASSSSSSSSRSSSSSSNYSSSSASALRNTGPPKFDHKYEEEYDEHDHHESKSGSPTSTICFGGKRTGANRNAIRGCYSMKNSDLDYHEQEHVGEACKDINGHDLATCQKLKESSG